MRHLNATWKIVIFFLILFSLLILGSTLKLLLKDPIHRRHILTRITAWLSKACLTAANIKVHLRDAHHFNQNRNHLIVANHMGMLDILSILAHVPSVFVTSYELKETPIVGWLTDAGGCVFVERRSRHNIHNEVAEIAAALKGNLSVTFFPEATSTNGDSVLPFKKSLFVSAAGTGVPILPITINYLTLNHRPVTIANRDNICWYGDRSFLSSLWRVMGNFSIELELVFHPTLLINSADERTFVAEESRNRIVSAFKPLNRST